MVEEVKKEEEVKWPLPPEGIPEVDSESDLAIAAMIKLLRGV
jgi:hypothetical protein